MSGSCKGLHCPGCGDGGGGIIALVLVVVVVAIAAKVARAVGQAVDIGAHIAAEVIEVVMISVASVVALAVAAGLGWAGVRAHRAYANRAAAAHRRVLDRPLRVVAEVVRDEPLPIEAPRPHAAGVEDLALSRATSPPPS